MLTGFVKRTFPCYAGILSNSIKDVYSNITYFHLCHALNIWNVNFKYVELTRKIFCSRKLNHNKQQLNCKAQQHRSSKCNGSHLLYRVLLCSVYSSDTAVPCCDLFWFLRLHVVFYGILYSQQNLPNVQSHQHPCLPLPWKQVLVWGGFLQEMPDLTEYVSMCLFDRSVEIQESFANCASYLFSELTS